MNIDFATSILKRIGHIHPPGCYGTYIEHPVPEYRQTQSVEIGFVIEHRFAFYYWLEFKHKLLRQVNLVSDKSYHPPDLITWDWHNDVGGECDFIEEELSKLNQLDSQEVAFFCWAGLRQINDGHIAPALWLNALGDVYVLQKQLDNDECEQFSHPIKDRYGREHNIWYFRTPEELAKHYEQENSGSGLFWDIDLDYFTKEKIPDDQMYAPPESKRIIRSLLNPKRSWMQQILRNLQGITIALEPEYTGGLSNSLELYQVWESVLFTEPVFSKHCAWKDNIFDN